MVKILLTLVLGLAAGFFWGRWSAPAGTEPASQVDSPPASETALAKGAGEPAAVSSKPLAAQEKEEAPPPAVEKDSPEKASDDPSVAVGIVDKAAKPEAEESGRESPPDYTPIDLRVADKLEQRRRRNALNLIRNSEPVDEMNPTLRGLLGRFAGDILLSNGQSYQMRMETEGKFVRQAFQGRSFVQLLRNGRPFSTSNNDGNLRNLRSVKDSKASLWIQMGDQYYLDAFYDADTDGIYGNFYGRNDKGDYRYRGFAHLVRQ